MRDSKAEFEFLDFARPSRTPGPVEPSNAEWDSKLHADWPLLGTLAASAVVSLLTIYVVGRLLLAVL